MTRNYYILYKVELSWRVRKWLIYLDCLHCDCRALRQPCSGFMAWVQGNRFGLSKT